MIPTVQLSRAKIASSRLAFGSSRLHHISQRKCADLLSCTAELGFAHLDTAPAYGDGASERVLGRFLRGKRDRFVVATKYGLSANPLVAAWPPLGMPVRIARFLARKVGIAPPSLPEFSARELRKSLEQSLRRLCCDWVDILLLHEPTIERVASPDMLLQALIELKEKGLIRTFGLAGAWSGISGLLAAAPELGSVLQTAEADWPANHPPDITYGAISEGPQRYGAPRIAPQDVAMRLRAALARRPQGVVIVSTTQIEHLRQLAEIAAGTAAA